MNNLDIMNHALRALDGPGVEPKLWSEMTSWAQNDWCEDYLPTLPADECASIQEQAARAYYNIIARHADRNGFKKNWVLG